MIISCGESAQHGTKSVACRRGLKGRPRRSIGTHLGDALVLEALGRRRIRSLERRAEGRVHRVVPATTSLR